MEVQQTRISLTKAYEPQAVYYHEADIVEYIRRDAASVHRRIDELLTLLLDMESREPIGFSLKGFRNFYLSHMQRQQEIFTSDFVMLTKVLEQAVTVFGDSLFDEKRKEAYRTAHDIAEEDRVSLTDLPHAA